jgi:hypothetical protein
MVRYGRHMAHLNSAPLAAAAAAWVARTAESAQVSVRALATGAAIPRPTLMRSLDGGRALTIDEFDRLATFLGASPVDALAEAIAA